MALTKANIAESIQSEGERMSAISKCRLWQGFCTVGFDNKIKSIE